MDTKLVQVVKRGVIASTMTMPEICNYVVMGRVPMTKKRGVSSITAFVDAAQLVKNVVNLKAGIRDKALLSMLILTGLRISEILSITRDQIRQQEDLDFVVIHDIQISKRWIRKYDEDHNLISRTREPILRDVPLPKNGFFQPLTEYVLRHLQTRPHSASVKLFNISRQRAWQITNALTGKWNHYFRSMRISHLINERNMSSVAVAKLLGVKESSTIDHYSKSEWKDHRDKLQ